MYVCAYAKDRRAILATSFFTGKIATGVLENTFTGEIALANVCRSRLHLFPTA